MGFVWKKDNWLERRDGGGVVGKRERAGAGGRGSRQDAHLYRPSSGLRTISNRMILSFPSGKLMETPLGRSSSEMSAKGREGGLARERRVGERARGKAGQGRPLRHIRATADTQWHQGHSATALLAFLQPDLPCRLLHCLATRRSLCVLLLLLLHRGLEGGKLRTPSVRWGGLERAQQGQLPTLTLKSLIILYSGPGLLPQNGRGASRRGLGGVQNAENESKCRRNP